MYIVAFILFIDFLGFGLIIPLTVIFQEVYNLTNFDIGLFTSIFFIANLIGGLIFGPLSDRFGRKPILLFTTLALAFAYIANAYIQISNTLNTFNYMILLRVIIGFFSGNIPVIFACSVDISKNNIEDRRKAMAILGVVIGLGFMLGPTLGGIFAELTSTKSIAPFYFSGLASLLGAILVALLFKESLSKKILNNEKTNIVISKQLLELLTNIKLLIPLLLLVGFFLTFTGFEVYLITMVFGYQLKLSQLHIGLMWTAFAFCNSFFQFALLKIANLRNSLILGFFIYGIGLLSYVVTAYSTLLVLISMFICAIGMAFILPNISALISLEGKPNQIGLLFGVNQSFAGIGRFLGPFLLSWIFTIFNSINAIWIFMAVLMLLQSFIVIKTIPKNYTKL